MLYVPSYKLHSSKYSSSFQNMLEGITWLNMLGGITRFSFANRVFTHYHKSNIL